MQTKHEVFICILDKYVRKYEFWLSVQVNVGDTLVVGEEEYYNVRTRRVVVRDGAVRVELYCEQKAFDSRDYDRENKI